MNGLPDEIVQKFRVISIERIEAIEAAWALVLSKLDNDAATLIHREVHTLKGESRAVGFTDVNLVCHKLEDLLEVARARGYAIDDDFDLAVNMALRFMVMLIKKKAGSHLGGIDLPGFVGQIDLLLKRHETHHRSRPGSVPPRLRASNLARLPPAVRTQLQPVALEAFLEYSVSKSLRRDRMRASWHTLRDLVGIARAMIGTDQLETARASVSVLAQTLGKRIAIKLEMPAAEVTAEILSALDAAALHLVRNAIDHGIESPEARVAAGKSASGTITVRGSLVNDVYTLSVADDGRGIDFARVRARAIELGLVPDNAELSTEKCVDLMCHPGFSTRTEANEISGRGVGLDAVRGAVVDVGGAVTATTEAGQGTTWIVTIPVPLLTAEGHSIRAPGLRFPVIVDRAWRPLDRPPELPIVVDLNVAFGFAPSTSISTRVFWFTDGKREIGLVCGGRPTPVVARRLVPTPPSSVAEVITLDGVEGILLRPERIPGVA